MKNKVILISFCAIFIVAILIIGVCTVTNNNVFSANEGRTLKNFPEISLEKLMTDDFYTDYTNAFADQLEYRESLIKWYYLVNFQNYISGVVRGEEEQLFYEPLIIKNRDEYIKKLKNVITKDMNKEAQKVVDAGSKFIFISIPRKDVVMDKYLPNSYIKGNEDYIENIQIIKENVSTNIEFIDAYEIFKDNSDECYDVYYQTDHHINIRGGYYIFEDIISRVNKDGYNIQLRKLEEEYEVYKLQLNGAFNRKVGQSITGKKEELVLIPRNTSLEYRRQDNGKGVNTKIFGIGNTYATAYMGNDYAETIVETNNDSAPNILFVGSSFTNVLESLAVYKFNKMVSVDYRHNTTGKSISDYVKEHDIDYTIFICSQSDNSLNVNSIKRHLGIK